MSSWWKSSISKGLDLHYRDARLCALYDLENAWAADNAFYQSLVGEEPQQILDLGCGTGSNALAFAARGHHVTAVDPAPEMLRIARHKAQQTRGEAVDWLQSSAQDFESSQRFDLIVLTGHTLQIFTPEELPLVLKVIQRQLAPQGRAVFETRSPHHDWAQNWNAAYELCTPQGQIPVQRKVLHCDEQSIRFVTEYQLETERLSSDSSLYFWTLDRLHTMIQAAGLVLTQAWGDWDGQTYGPHSKEIIVSVRRRPDNS